MKTVLIVEDEELVRNLARDILDAAGHKVLIAQGAEEALAIAKSYADPIHLLLTDVILPRINGKALYEKLSTSRTDLKVLYISGYGRDVVATYGVSGADVHFLPKPFSVKALKEKVREVLEEL